LSAVTFYVVDLQTNNNCISHIRLDTCAYTHTYTHTRTHTGRHAHTYTRTRTHKHIHTHAIATLLRK